jgi:hypothetical protein
MKLGVLCNIDIVYVTDETLLRLKTGCTGRWHQVLTAILTLFTAL